MTVFARARWAVAIAIVLAIGAAARYPGGTTLDASSKGYSISHNFLSDLGMTVAYDGHPNRLGAFLFVASLNILVVGLGGCLVGVVRLYSRSPGARRLARVSTRALCGRLLLPLKARLSSPHIRRQAHTSRQFCLILSRRRPPLARVRGAIRPLLPDVRPVAGTAQQLLLRP